MNEELVVQIRAEISDLKKQVETANKTIKGIGTNGKASVNTLNSALKTLGKTIATVFSVKVITDFTKEIINCSAEVQAEESAFLQIMGDYADTASEKMSGIADATGMVDTRLTTYMTSMTAKFKGLGYGIDEATDLATKGLTMACDASAFWDMSLDEATSHLNSFINGSYEGGEAIGLFANDTQMAMYAVEQGIISSTKAWSSLDEATKQATRLEYAQAMMDLSGATGQASKEAESFANVQANLNEKWRQFKAEIGEPVLQDIAIPAMKMLSEVIDVASVKYEEFSAYIPAIKEYFVELGNYIAEIFAPVWESLRNAFDNLKEAFQPLIDKLVGFIKEGSNATDETDLLQEALGFLADIVEKLADFIEDVSEKIRDFSKWCEENEDIVYALEIAIGVIVGAFLAYKVAILAITVATTAYGIVMGVITSPITLVVLAITALIAIIAGCVLAWGKIKEKVSEVVGNIKSKVAELKTNISTKFDEIKEKMLKPVEDAKTAISKVIDKIKGLFNFQWSLPKLSVPKFTITPVGWKVGDLLKGSIPRLSVSWNAQGGIFDKPTIMSYGDSLQGLGENGAEAIVPLEKNTMWLDRMAEMIVEKTGNKPVVIEVDGNVFGKTAVSTINQNTRQSGKLQLVW